MPNLYYYVNKERLSEILDNAENKFNNRDDWKQYILDKAFSKYDRDAEIEHMNKERYEREKAIEYISRTGYDYFPPYRF